MIDNKTRKFLMTIRPAKKRMQVYEFLKEVKKGK